MSNVPTNLIPTRITGLPDYLGTSTAGYIPYILEGRTYKVQFSQIAAVGAVPSSRVVAAGTGLTGGGDLSENRVISIANGGVGYDQLSATGVAAGSYGSGSEVPVITVDLKGRVTDVSTTPLVITGYVPDSRLISTGAGLLGGGSLASNRTLSVDFSSATPQALGSATAGVSNAAARGDHVHPAVDLSDANQTQGALPLGRGGTGDALSPVAGAVVYSTGTKLALADPGEPGQLLTSNGTGEPYWSTVSGTGTVTSVSVLTANGFGGTVAFANTTPQITINTTVTGILKGNGTSVTSASPGVDYALPGANNDITSMTGLTGGISTPDYIDFDTTAAPARATGRLWWDNADGIQTLNLGMAGSNATLQIGEEMYFRIKASSAITEGQVVMFTGTVGNSGALTGAPATGLTKDTASYVMGVATEDIANNGWGYVTQFGLVRGIDTTGGAEAWVDGQILYYNPAVPGGLTKTVPTAPAAKVEMAAVVKAGTNGSLFVRPIARFSLTQLNDVESAGASNLDLLQYNGTGGYWEHKSPTTISVGTATNLAGGAANRIAYQTGAGATGFISAPVTPNTFLEWSGSAFQWSSNPLGTVTSVAMSVPTGLTVSGSPITTSGTLAVGLQSGYSIPTNASQANWDAAYSDRLQWDGGSTNLVAATGRTSLGLGTAAVLNAGVANGVATLDSAGTVPTSQLPAAVLGALNYQGAWNASTNTPTLTSGVGTKGYFYVVDVAGSTNLDGITDWKVGDWAVFSGSVWQKIDNTDSVTSVNGYTGAVSLTYSDVGAPSTSGTGATGTWAISVTGNAGTVTNGVYTSGSYTDPTWLVSLAASKLTGTVAVANGGTGSSTAAGARTNLGGTTVGSNFFTLTNPSAITFPQINADNTVSALDAASFRAAIGAGTGGGSVSSVDVSGGTTGLTTSGGPITSSGTITLAGTLNVANGGTGATSLSSGYVLKGNGTSAVSASVIYDDGTNVGVGTPSPGAKFDVRSGYILAGTASSTEGTKILGGYYSSGSLTTFGSERSNGGPVIGYGVWPSTVAEASFVSATGINVARGAYTMVGNVHKWFAGGAQTVAVDSAVSMSEAMRLDASGNLLNYTSVRAPIFYDYNNTAYYLDAAGTSLLGGALFNNVTIDPSSIGAGVGVGTITESSTGFSAPGIAFGGGTGQHGAIVYAGDTMYFGAENGSDNTLGVRATLNNSGSFAATGDVRAPIFYDSNNTAYYLNPESTSVLYEVSTYYIRNKQTGNRALYIDGTTWNQFADPDGATKLWLGGTLDPNNYYNGNVHYFRNNSSGNTMTIDASGIVVATAQMRAPIFYDSDNTAYYLDPASTSNLGQINFGDSTKFIRGGASGQIILGAGSASDAYIQVGGSYYPIWNSGNFTPGNYMPISGGTFTGAVTFPGGSLVSIDGGIRARFNNGGSGAVYFGSGDNYLYYDGANFTLNGGYVYNASSFRAPVFYDSNDTGYYVDAASNTVLNTLYLRNSGIPVQAKFAQASQFGYSSSYRTVVLGNEYLTTISMGVDVSGNASGSFNGQGEGREVIFRNGVNFITPNSANNGYHQVLQLSDGNGYFGNIAQAAGSLRAPIFYDSDNTGYYVNPAGTSYVLGEFQVQQSGISGLRIISGTGTQSLWVRAGYDTDGTGTPASSPYNIEFQSSGSSGGSFTFVSGNTKALTITSDYAQGAGSLRAPIYYDSDNTSYYWNINGGSGSNIYTYITGLAYYTCQFGNNVYSGAVSSPPLQAFSSDGGTAMMSFHRAGAYAVNFGLDPDNYLRIGGWSAGSNRWVLDMSGNNWVASSFRAPIFYDSDNTGYYVDPASGSRLNGNVSIGAGAYDVARLSIKKDTSGVTPADSASIVLSNRSTAINGTLAGGIFMDTYRDVRDPHYSGGIWFTRNQEVSNLSSSSDIVFGAMISWDSGLPTERMRVYGSGGYVGATNSFRAPVFYDSNDTNYYLDPASTSNLNRLLLQPRIDNYYVGSVSSTDPVSDWQSLTNTTGQFVVSQFNNFGAGGFSNYPSGVYTYGAVLSWRTTNHSFQLYASHTGDLAYKTQWQNDNYSGWLTPVVYGRNAGSSSGKTIYGTVLYDADNTGYYVDPTGSTSLRTVGDWRSDSSAWTGEFNGKIQYHASNWYFQGAGSWEFRRSDSANAFYVTQGGVAGASSDFRAPIFYDSNNTGYYVDANSESVLNTLTLFGELNLSASGINYIDHTGTIYFRNQSGYATSATLTTGGNFTATGNVTAYSDARLKDNVKTVSDALDLVSAMRGVTYTRKDTGSEGVGVIAQEMREIIPQVVQESEDGTLSVAYGNLVGVLIEAIKELKSEVNDLKAKLH